MFEIFKKRDLNAYINDTFSFFKIEGKTYFKNYIILNGGLLLILVICFYFIGKIFLYDTFNYNHDIDDFLNTNFYSAGFILAIFILISIIFSVIAYTYPIIYLQNMIDGGANTPNTYIKIIKKQFGRILIFTLGLLFLILPLMLICLFISILLMFLLIGIPLFLLLLIGFSSWISLAYYEYINNKTPFFTAFGRTFDMIRSNFWPIIGTTFIMYMIVQIVVGIVSFIPQIYYYIKLFTTLESNQMNPEMGILFGIVAGITMVVSMIFNFFLNNLLLINQGLIYYSERERKENITSHSIIDDIGRTND